MPLKGPYGFIGGWNTKGSTTSIPENSMSDANDVNIVYGDLAQRKGSMAINGSAISGTPAVHGLFDWQTIDGKRFLIVTAGNKIYSAQDLFSTFTDITGTVLINSGQNNQSTFASLNNYLVRCGGTVADQPISWNGTGNAATLSAAPQGSLVCVANNFMFISGLYSSPSFVQWSNVGDPTTWTASNFIYYRKNDGDKITALIEFNQNLLIFKRRSIGQLWTVTSNPGASITLGPLTTIISNVGAAGSQCVDKIGDGRIAFLGADAHVYLFDGSTVEDISDQPYPKPSIQPTLDNIAPIHLQYAVLKYYPTRNEIWISVCEPAGTTNNAIYVYSLTYSCWESRFSNISANVMATSLDTRGTPSHNIIMLTGNYGGFVYEQDRGSTNAENSGALISGNATMPIFFSGDSMEFIPRSSLIPIAENGNTTLTINYGFNEFTSTGRSTTISQLGTGGALDTFTLDTSVLGGNTTLYRTARFSSTGRTHSMQIQFQNNNSAQDFTVHPFYISDEVIPV